MRHPQITISFTFALLFIAISSFGQTQTKEKYIYNRKNQTFKVDSIVIHQDAWSVIDDLIILTPHSLIAYLKWDDKNDTISHVILNESKKLDNIFSCTWTRLPSQITNTCVLDGQAMYVDFFKGSKKIKQIRLENSYLNNLNTLYNFIVSIDKKIKVNYDFAEAKKVQESCSKVHIKQD